ncbi:uncharacterized protein LOC115674603 [Syzygium oleosum]|uniref:uncharacterized protein LOC115674603 n=1 Tax=Syzygium oleosum TaxID=219896 RepID=UPI0024BA345A|nr:uncharacterized protein LOC115674603 [Syzygium oleosum]
MKSKAAAPSKRVYEDFEPECKWNNEEGRDIIELHVQGFKKDQLRVQASSSGALTVTGERPLDDRRWSRFRKEFKLPNKYKLNETRAKLAGDVLHVILLKERPPQAADATQVKPQTGGGLGRSGSGKPAAAAVAAPGGTNDGMLWLRAPSWVVGIDKKRVLLVLAAVAALVGVGVGGFLTWRYLIL